MRIEIQLICFFISFLYGMLINFSMRVHRKLLKKTYWVSKVFISFIMVIMYVDVLFFINNGNFHIYFVFMIIFGFFVGRKFTNKM